MSRARDLADSADNNLDSISVDASGNVTANRLSTDGSIVTLQKDGSTVGSIGYFNSPEFVIGRANNGVGFSSSVNALYPTNPSSGSIRGDTMDLGFSTGRWKNLYLSGGVYLGGTGSANYLDDYEEGTWTPTFNTGTTATPTAVTHDVQDGEYTKIGNLVHVQFRIGSSSYTQNTSNDYIQITNLPFNPTAPTGNFVASMGNFEAIFLTINSTTHYNITTDTGNIISIRRCTSGGGNDSTKWSDVTDKAAFEIRGSVWYYTAA